MASGADICRGRYWINADSGLGFSESFYFNTADRVAARNSLYILANYRRLLLPFDEHLVFASVSRLDATRDGLALDLADRTDGFELTDSATLVGGLPVIVAETGNGIENCDVIERGMLARFYTFAGKRKSQIFRGLRDSWVSAQRLVVKPNLALTYAGLAAVAAGFTPEDAMGSFLIAAMTLTCGIKKTAPDTYTVFSWDGVKFLRVSKRDCGAGYSESRGRKRATV